jgi:hypothetical protein
VAQIETQSNIQLTVSIEPAIAPLSLTPIPVLCATSLHAIALVLETTINSVVVWSLKGLKEAFLSAETLPTTSYSQSMPTSATLDSLMSHLAWAPVLMELPPPVVHQVQLVEVVKAARLLMKEMARMDQGAKLEDLLKKLRMGKLAQAMTCPRLLITEWLPTLLQSPTL